MMGDMFWTQKTTPHKWLQKVRNGRTWQKQREKLETAFAENSGAARKRFAESMDRLLISDVVKGYWDVFGDIGDVLSEMWDDMDLTESKLQLNVIGMLTEEWIKAYGGQKGVEEVSVLRTERANELWEIAKEHGWVDDNLMPMLDSDGKVAILAKVMATVLELSPQWQPFEELWNKKDLSVKFSKAKDYSYYPSLYKEVERAFR